MLPAPETALARHKETSGGVVAGPGQEVHTRDERQERRGKKRGAKEERANDGRRGRAREISGELRARSRHVKERRERQEKKHRRLESKRAMQERKKERDHRCVTYGNVYIAGPICLFLSASPPPGLPFFPRIYVTLCFAMFL